MISVYSKRTNNNLTIRDEDAIRPYVKLIQWGRKHPVQFIEKILQIPLMDYQKWLISMTWNAEYAVWVCSRNAGKSFLIGVFTQARAILYPKTKIHIMSTGSRQANETFETMENIAKHQVKTLLSDNEVFMGELKRSNSDTDGFTHDAKKGSGCDLLNGSFIKAVTGSAKTVRGKRSNVNIYDEAGTIPREFYDATEPFVTQSADFKTGASYDPEVYPQEVPNLRLYAGSASDTNSLFWEKYKEGAKQMLMGNSKYFVADLSCEIPLHPTMNGNPVKPLLSQDEIDRKMRENEIIAMREYYNIFDRFDLEDCVVSRSDIYLNTEDFIPQLGWGGKKHKYIIAWDPASKNDNSPLLVTEYYKDPDDKTIKGRIVHMENLIKRYEDGSRRPMTIDEQVARLRAILYEYNGRDNIAPYDNVTLLLDAGTGGQAPAIAQELCKTWEDSNGHKHPGVYDEESPDMVRWVETLGKGAVPGVLHLLEPSKYRTAMFEATRILVPAGHIKFPPTCPKNGTLVLEDGVERKLSKAEQASLNQMDLMKEEMVSMVRRRTDKGTVSYGLPPEKKKKMNDDRNYVAIMSIFWVKTLRDAEDIGETAPMDFMGAYTSHQKPTQQVVHELAENNPFLGAFRSKVGSKKAGASPFTGKSPFTR